MQYILTTSQNINLREIRNKHKTVIKSATLMEDYKNN